MATDAICWVDSAVSSESTVTLWVRLNANVISSTSSKTWRAVRSGWVVVSMALATIGGTKGRIHRAAAFVTFGISQWTAAGLGASRQVLFGHGFGCALQCGLDGSIEGLGDATAMQLAIDLVLCLDGEPGTGELLIGPHVFDGGAHLRTLHGDRGVRVDLGAIAPGARGCAAIVGGLAAQPIQDQRQQAQQYEECDRDRPQYECARARQRVVVHGDPACTEAAVGVRDCGLACGRQRLFGAGDF